MGYSKFEFRPIGSFGR